MEYLAGNTSITVDNLEVRLIRSKIKFLSDTNKRTEKAMQIAISTPGLKMNVDWIMSSFYYVTYPQFGVFFAKVYSYGEN